MRESKISISLDKVLTISATEWAESQGVALGDYRFVGVQVSDVGIDIHAKFAKEAPANAEAVVAYRSHIALACEEGDVKLVVTAEGTAMIRKS